MFVVAYVDVTDVLLLSSSVFVAIFVILCVAVSVAILALIFHFAAVSVAVFIHVCRCLVAVLVRCSLFPSHLLCLGYFWSFEQRRSDNVNEIAWNSKNHRGRRHNPGLTPFFYSLPMVN